MSAHAYCPSRGHAVELEFDPQAGHEQAGTRPGLCLSNAKYNDKTSLGIFCPITNQTGKYPWEVPLPAGLPITGVVLADQVKSMDWRERNAIFLCKMPPGFVEQVEQLFLRLLV